MSATTNYYVPAQSRLPILASVSLFLMAFGAGGMLNDASYGTILLLLGAASMAAVVYNWFGKVIEESHQGLYSAQMDRSFRWGMSWFIFSEIMFFAAFFGTLFYVRTFAVPWLGGEGDKGVSNMLWEGFAAQWPLMETPGEKFQGPEGIISPWALPLVNTILLVTSSFTLTFAHKALVHGGTRENVIKWMWVTIALGVVFLFCQGYEYYEAYTHYGLTLQSGIYGATFFILTGFHGAHVTLGTIMMIIITLRLMKGHFTAKSHFGFEATAWYWHFVDVVWIGLFIFVYVF